MRLLFLGNFLVSSGGTIGVSESLSVLLEEKGFSIRRVSTKRIKLFRWLDMTWAVLRGGYDLALVDVFSGQAFFWAFTCGALLSAFRKPFILTLHGGGLGTFAYKHQITFGWLLRKADRVQSPSSYLINSFGGKFGQIHYLPNGLDLSLYVYRRRDQIQGKLIWLRSIHEIYAPWVPVEAIGLLGEEGYKLQLEMVGPDKGDGSYARVKERMNHYGLNANICICGGIPKNEVPEKLNSADIFLNSTRFESFGVSVMEAAACGLPIVTTNVGELSYLWEDGVDALLVPPDDPQAMADAIRRIMSEPGLAEKLSTNARRKAESFDWLIILAKWENILSDYENE